MAQVKKSERIEAPAADVWALVSEFNGLPSWMAAVAKSETEGDGIGAVRTLTMQDGAAIKERLDSIDPSAMTYSYTMVDTGPLPLGDYHSTVTVAPASADACTVTWVGDFDSGNAPEADAVGLVNAVYDGGIAGIREKLKG